MIFIRTLSAIKSIRNAAFSVLMLIPATAAAAPSPNSLTILIDGFASASPLIGYGLRNLRKKIPDAQLYSYVGAVEGWTYIAPKVIRDVEKAYRRDPDIEINLIGVSFGANLLTRIVAKLDERGVPVSYLGIIDGLPLTPITPNVRRVDNFTCSLAGCLRDKIELTKNNYSTIANAFDYKTTHIRISNHSEVQQRILHQISTFPLDLLADPECELTDQQHSVC
ncbi:MAG: hypothetical protein ACR2O0_11835 [Rhizobiaceae bacterium]